MYKKGITTLKKLIKPANRLDALGQYGLANKLDAICREAADVMDTERIQQLMRQMYDPAEEDQE